MTNLSGQSLGRYHILEQLGEGGMATVYKALDTRLERYVAVKVIRSGAFPPEQLGRMLKRFEHEAKALASLSHPNIVKVLDYGEHDGSPFIVMEFLPGGTLKHRVGRPIPWGKAVETLLPIAQALGYAHEHGLIHRDVKSSNILLTDKGQPMLTDFGIAKILETEETGTLTGTGVGIGTPEYMAPEQWTGGATTQSDIYSLGIVLYEMVTGRKPYMADTPAAILLKQATEPLPRPTQYAPDLPEGVERVLIKALAKNSQNRYQTMTEFAAAMEKLAQGKQPELSAFAGNTFTTMVESPRTTSRETTFDSGDGLRSPNRTLSTELQRKPAIPTWVYILGGGMGGLTILAICVGILFASGILGGSLLAPETPFLAFPTATEADLLPTSPPTNPTDMSPFPTLTEVVAPGSVPTLTPFPSVTTAPTLTLVPTLTPRRSSEPTGRIVYTCQVSGNSDFNEICMINADGSGFRQLTHNGANNGWPSFSPDGNTIFYSSNIPGSFQIYSMSSGGQSVQQLTFGPDEAFSPDLSQNGQIVYKNGNSQADSIWVMNSDGGGARQVYGNGWDPVWSADGSQIVFASGEFNAAQLYIVNANGSGLRQLTHTPNLRGRSDWSIQNLIAFYAGLPWQRNLFLIGSDGSNLTQLTNGGNSQGPAFSPDGEWVVFTGYFDHMNDVNGCEIYIIRVDGSDQRRLTDNSYCDWQPRWGP